MSSIVTEQGILHYESIGRGKPVILLHGWINSWDVWRDVMITLAREGQHRVYALDFWGFGDSARAAGATETTFQINSYVEMVLSFMNSLGIQKAPILGHSMGGTVALQIALEYPERIEKVAIVGAPIIGRSLNPFLQLAGYGSIAKLIWRYPIMLHSIMRILLAKDSKKVRGMIFRDIQRTTLESFFRSIGDLRQTDLRDQLSILDIPALGIYGVKDNIVSPSNAELLMNGMQNAEITMFYQSRHFPMTDEPQQFIESVIDFLDSEAPSSISGNKRNGKLNGRN